MVLHSEFQFGPHLVNTFSSDAKIVHDFWSTIKCDLTDAEFEKIRKRCFPKHEMVIVTKKYIDSRSRFHNFETFWSKTQYFSKACTSIIFHKIRHHFEKVLQKNVCKSVAYWMTKQMPISPFTVFVANFLDHIVFVKTNSSEVFSHHIIYFSTSFCSNIFQNPQINLHETKIKRSKKIELTHFFFPKYLKARIFWPRLKCFFSFPIQVFFNFKPQCKLLRNISFEN